MKVLLDTNIVLDLLLDRKPHSQRAAEVFGRIEQGQIQGLLCATTMTTIDYLLSQAMRRKEARGLLSQLMKLFEIAPVNRAVIEDALASRIHDFEDAVLDHAARHSGADIIVTRNAKDFVHGKTKLMDPQEILALLRK